MKLSHIQTIILFLCFTGFLTAQKQKTKHYTVSGKVSQTSSYCGGARPPEEMMEQYAKSKPYPGKIFYIRKGNVNESRKGIVLKFVTDSAGQFSIQLPAGIYSIIQAEQVKALNLKKYVSNEFIKIDKECLKTWWKKPYRVLEIKDNDLSGLDFNFHHPCFITGDLPCKNYVGPMPL